MAADDWIKIRIGIHDDPSVVLIERATNLNADTIVGKLVKFWGWADAHCEETESGDGFAPGIDARWIDRLVGRRGFGNALASAGWAIFDDRGITLPRYANNNGTTGKSRAQAAKRQQRLRNLSRSCHDDVTLLSRSERDEKRTRGEERRGEERREENPPTPQGGGVCVPNGNQSRGVSDTDRKAAEDALNAWSTADRGTPLLPHRNELAAVWDALEEIRDMPPVPTPVGSMPAVTLIGRAVQAKRAERTKFKSVKFALGCVRAKLTEWADAGVSDQASDISTMTAAQLAALGSDE